MSDLYDLPDGWEYVKLTDIAGKEKTSIKRGPFGSALKKEFFVESGYKVYEQKNAIKDDFSLGEYYIDDSKFIELKGFEVKGGDIIISCSGTIGRISVAPMDIERGIINQALLKLTLNNNVIDTKYFVHFWIDYVNKGMSEESTKGAAIKNIASVKVLKELDIPLPPLSEQQRIVSKLDKLFEKIDKAIALHQKNMDEADVFMGSVLNDVFGELEEKYGKTPISDVMKISNKTLVPNDNDEYNYVGLENIESHNGKLVDFSPTLGNQIKSSKVEFEKGMVLYGKLRPYLNKVWIADFDGVATTEILPFYAIDKNGLDMGYVKYFFLSPSYLSKVMNNCSGARMPRLTTKFIKSDDAYIPIPSVSTQQKVVTYLDEITHKIEKVKSIQKEKMDSLTALKASILDKAFRGEL